MPKVDTSLQFQSNWKILLQIATPGRQWEKWESCLVNGKVKMGKLRPNEKISSDKCRWRYTGWIDLYGSADCRRAMELMKQDQTNKYNGMKFVKIGKFTKLM